MRKYGFLLLITFLLLVEAGCGGTFEVGIERTPTPDLAQAATVTALMAEKDQLATRVAMQVTPTPTPPPRLGRLVYVQGGDIWVKALPAGAPQRLTTDGHNHEPRWSPSGQWLAFRKERQVFTEEQVPCEIPKPRAELCVESVSVLLKQVWVIEVDSNSAHSLGQSASVEAFAWSPVDDRLAYTTATAGLSMINADGTDLVTLVSHPRTESGSWGRVGRFAWSPDGMFVAYEWRVPSSDPLSTYQGLWQASTDGKERMELYASGLPKKGEAVLAGWSPLGRRVLFWQSETNTAPLTEGVSLYSVNAGENRLKVDVPVPGGSAQTMRLEAEEAVLSYADFVAPAPSRSSSGASDAVASVLGVGKSTWKNKRIVLDGQILSPKNLAAISPTWSPDGAHLAFSAMPDHAEGGNGESVPQELMQRRIWVMNVLGEPQPRRLTNASTYRDERPLWSADGSHILFARIDTRGRASLWIITVDSSMARQVVDELTPAPDPVGFYGYIDWDDLSDWWREI